MAQDKLHPRMLGNWAAKRKKGALSFITTYGVIIIGFSSFFVFTFIINDNGRKPYSGSYIKDLSFYCFFGGIMSSVIWVTVQTKYQNTLASFKDEKNPNTLQSQIISIMNNEVLSNREKSEMCEDVLIQYNTKTYFDE